MSTAPVVPFSRQPRLSQATASEPDASYTLDLHRWLIQWHQEYVTTINQIVASYLALDGSTSMTGDLIFGATGLLITGDFSNATLGKRIAFQTSTTDGATSVAALPNGTSTASGFVFLSNSDATAAQAIGVVYQSGTVTYIQASTANSGTQGSAAIAVGANNVLVAEANNDLVLGPSGAATAMAAGFPYIPAAAGAPTGTPTVRAGYVPLYYDSTGNNLYAYNGSAWKKVALT